MRNGSEPGCATAGMAARVLIVEDEAHARHYLRELLEGEPLVEVVGESPNGVQGAQQIRELSPDIVFVDIQMPGLDGFGMIDQIAGSRQPLFVFVTGYSDYAVRAFEIEAVDGVLREGEKNFGVVYYGRDGAEGLFGAVVDVAGDGVQAQGQRDDYDDVDFFQEFQGRAWVVNWMIPVTGLVRGGLRQVKKRSLFGGCAMRFDKTKPLSRDVLVWREDNV